MSSEFQYFLSTLIQTGSYKTPENNQINFLDRVLGRFDVWYYLNLFRIIVSARIAVAVGKFNYVGWMEKAYAVFRLIERCGGKIEITDYKHIAHLKRPVVFVANHMSSLETLILPPLLITPQLGITVVIKNTLLKYPFFGPVVKHINPIVVGRKDAIADYMRVIEHGVSAIQSGRSVLVFPEATRRTEFNPRNFNTLGVKLALHAQTQLIPVAVKTDFQGLGKIIKDIGPLYREQTIRFKFGAPLTVDGNGRTAHTESVMFIAQTLREWGIPVHE